MTGISSDISFGSGKSEDNSMHVQQCMNAFLPVMKVLANEDLNFEMLGGGLTKVAVSGMGLDASTLLTSFAASAMI